MPKTIGAAKFKEGCLKILDELEPEGLVITKNGRAVARLTPIHGAHGKWIGAFRDALEIKGDVLTTGVRWDAESGHERRSVRPARRTKGT